MPPAPQAKQAHDSAIDTHGNGKTVAIRGRRHMKSIYRPAKMFSALDWCVASTKDGQIPAAGSVTISAASMTSNPPDTSRSEVAALNTASNGIKEQTKLMAGVGCSGAAVLSATVAEIKEQTKIKAGVGCSEAAVLSASVAEIREQAKLVVNVGCSEVPNASVAEIKEQMTLVVEMGCSEAATFNAFGAEIKEQISLVASLERELTRAVHKLTVA